MALLHVKGMEREVLLIGQRLAFCHSILSWFGIIPTAVVRRRPKLHPGYRQNAATNNVNHVHVKFDLIFLCEL